MDISRIYICLIYGPYMEFISGPYNYFYQAIYGISVRVYACPPGVELQNKIYMHNSYFLL